MRKAHIDEVLTARASAERKIRAFLKRPTGIDRDRFSLDTFHNRLIINCESFEEVKNTFRILSREFEGYRPQRQERVVSIWAELWLVEFRDPRIDYITIFYRDTKKNLLYNLVSLSEGDFHE